MSNIDATPDVVDRSRARLRLKRIFLWAMVSSLTSCAGVAILVLLFWDFNETTGRVLGTLGALAFHSGMALACASSLERRRWPALSVAGLVLFGVNFVVLVTCIWWPGISGDDIVRAVLTTPALLGYYILAIPCAVLVGRKHVLPLVLGGLAACIVGLAMLLVCIWADSTYNPSFVKATAIAAIFAFSLAHTCLLVRVPAGRSLDRLKRGAVICVWLAGAMLSWIVLYEPDDEFPFRLLGALGVLDACGSLGLVIMVRLRGVQKIENLTSTAARIEIHCPRCTTAQTVEAGASKCGVCGLRFRIEIEEPRCARCDYLLWQLPQRRCPECGTPF